MITSHLTVLRPALVPGGSDQPSVLLLDGRFRRFVLLLDGRFRRLVPLLDGRFRREAS
jgi:hypothetical protein